MTYSPEMHHRTPQEVIPTHGNQNLTIYDPPYQVSQSIFVQFYMLQCHVSAYQL